MRRDLALGLCLALAPAVMPVPVWGDADPLAGRAVVVGGLESVVAPCFRCHGIEGVGDSAGAFPRLTGQAAFYLYKQLIDYASGARPNEVMSPIAREMSEQQIVDVAAWYAAQDAPYPPPEAPPALVERGRQIAEEGLPEAGLQACGYCHGENGTGIPPSFPYLAGQYAPYIELQLFLWKRGIRANDPLNVMVEVAESLSESDIRALAAYFASLQPSRERSAEVMP